MLGAGRSLHNATAYTVIRCSTNESWGGLSNGRSFATFVEVQEETDGPSSHSCQGFERMVNG